jgi:transposase
MLPQFPAAVRVFLCTRPTDMRKSFDGLLGLVHEFLGQDPLSGHLFLFLNRSPVRPASSSPRRTSPSCSPALT